MRCPGSSHALISRKNEPKYLIAKDILRGSCHALITFAINRLMHTPGGSSHASVKTRFPITAGSSHALMISAANRRTQAKAGVPMRPIGRD